MSFAIYGSAEHKRIGEENRRKAKSDAQLISTALRQRWACEYEPRLHKPSPAIAPDFTTFQITVPDSHGHCRSCRTWSEDLSVPAFICPECAAAA